MSRRTKQQPKKGKQATAAAPPPGRRAGLLVGAGVLGGIVVAAFLAQGMERAAGRDFFARFGSLQSLTSLGGRLPLWESAVRIMSAHPLFGVGPDSFRLGWYPFRQVSHLAWGAGLIITDPHDVPLLLAATLGAVGLLAFAWMAGSLLFSGTRVGFASDMTPSRAEAGADYRAWLFGTVGILVTFLTSMMATVLAFSFFLALGVLVAPTLGELERGRATGALRATSFAVALALAAFGVATAAAQVTAVTSRVADPHASLEAISRAASIARWDTEIRQTRISTMVQAALADVFQDRPGAAQSVADAEKQLAAAAAAEPNEYNIRYQSAVLLIGAGKKLGTDYTRRGVKAAKQGLALYPNSLPLRTGLASAWLELGDPKQAVALLRDVWSVDTRYAAAGVTYADALSALGSKDDARAVLAVLQKRFKDDQSVSDLGRRLSQD